MWMFLLFCLAVLVVGVLLHRIARLESRIEELTARVDVQGRAIGELRRQNQAAPAKAPAPEPVMQPVASPPPVPKLAPPVIVTAPEPPPPRFTTTEPRHTVPTREWETVLGGNWLNKIGVFVLVVGLALLLRYSFTQFGPAGRVTICLSASLSLLAAGALLESRERYRIFARGLLGGGWAGLYVTVYAMHAVEAAKVIDSPVAGAVLLLGVAAGMIVHSLRYQSPTVTGLAYFVAFGTLAITDMTSLPFLALIPLAASLLYVSHLFLWKRMAMLGMIATYAVVVLRGDTGAPLWQAQTIFALYWLLFEAFDILHPEQWLLPINAAGALGLSILKWQTAAPHELWMFLAVAAAAYLVSAALRIRSQKWHGAATLTAGLIAAAIFAKLDHQWITSALVIEAEIFYLAGIRLRARYLRWLGTGLFGLEALRLLGNDAFSLAGAQWVPVACLDAVVFYANRAMFAADQFYGYAGAAAVALAIGRADEPYRTVAWQAAAAVAFAFGWWRRLFDFRCQGYLLLVLGLIGTGWQLRAVPLSLAVAICYAAVLCALWSASDRFLEQECDFLRLAGAGASLAAGMALLWRLVPIEYLGVAWIALAALVLELGLRRLPTEFARAAYALALLGTAGVSIFNFFGLHSSGPWPPRLIPVWAALLSYAIALRARREEDGAILTAWSSIGLVFSFIALWALLPAVLLSPAWAAATLLLLLTARSWQHQPFKVQSYAAAGAAYLYAISRLPDASSVIWSTCLAIACFYAAQFLSPRDSRERTYFSLLATTMTTALLYYQIKGSMLTVAYGIQGVILLASGFPLRDRVLRISGLVLLLACILKLFVWDLRHLETLPRIFSFIALGLILLGVSWVYTRFREQVAKLL